MKKSRIIKGAIAVISVATPIVTVVSCGRHKPTTTVNKKPKQPVKTVAQPTQPVAQPTQPVAQPTQSVQTFAQPTQPVAKPTQSVQTFAQPTQPVAHRTQLSKHEGQEPVNIVDITPMSKTQKNEVMQHEKVVQEKLHDITKIDSDTPISVNSQGELIFPKHLSISGQKGNVTIQPIKDSGTYNLLYYKMSKDLKHASPLDLTKNIQDIGNGDKVLVVGQNSSNKQYGFMYDIFGINDPNQTFSDFDDGGIGQRILNKTSSFNDYLAILSNLEPGKAYSTNAKSAFDNLVLSNSVSMIKTREGLGVPEANDSYKDTYSFGPYNDFSMNPDESSIFTDYPKTHESRIAFVQAEKQGSDAVSAFGGNQNVNETLSDAQLGQKIWNSFKAVRNSGGFLTLSFGGASGSPIYENGDPVVFAKELIELVKGTGVHQVDYDVEGGKVENTDDIKNLALGTALAQTYLDREHYDLNVSLTLASALDGVPDNRLAFFDTMYQAGVRVKNISSMTMMMSHDGSLDPVDGIFAPSFDALIKQAKSIANKNNLVNNDGNPLSDDEIAAMVGATIDIGADTWAEEKLHTQTEVDKLYQAVLKRKLGFFGLWKATADINGGAGYPSGAIHKAFQNYSDTLKAANPTVVNDRGYGIKIDDKEKFIADELNEFYSNSVSSSTASTKIGILPRDANTGNNPFVKGQWLYEYVNKSDNKKHLYSANWYVNPGENPGNKPSEFNDLGLEDIITKATGSIKDIYDEEKQSGQIFHEGGSASVPSPEKALQGGVEIKDFDSNKIYDDSSKHVVFYNGKMYINNYYIDPGLAPTGDQWGPWSHITL